MDSSEHRAGDPGPTGTSRADGPRSGTSPDTGSSASEAHTLRDRILAATAYVGPGFLLPILMGAHTSHVRWHTAQGFVLFFLEALTLAFVVLLDATLGRVPLLGLVIMLVVRAAALAGFVVVSAIGFVKAFAGEHLELPWLEQYARRLPIVENASTS